MTKAQMTAFLNTTGIPADEWINGGKLGLYSINLDSDGNEIISDTNKYYFDFCINFTKLLIIFLKTLTFLFYLNILVVRGGYYVIKFYI